MFLVETKSLAYHAYTVWLFTRSDLKTIVIPSTLFALVCALSGPPMTSSPVSSNAYLVKNTVKAIFWVWINLLPFAIQNQRQQESVAEDATNKPWRPMPSRRLSFSQATFLMLLCYCLAFLSSLILGGKYQCIALIGLGYWYNELRGADSSWVIRNLINGFGYICFTSGALEVILGSDTVSLGSPACQWLTMVGTVVFTTIQSQDMADQAGDALRKRLTAPLVMGDLAARWTIAAFVGVWSLVCPLFWDVLAPYSTASVVLGVVVASRFLLYRDAEADKKSALIYNLWIVSLYFLPLIRSITEHR